MKIFNLSKFSIDIYWNSGSLIIGMSFKHLKYFRYSKSRLSFLVSGPEIFESIPQI